MTPDTKMGKLSGSALGRKASRNPRKKQIVWKEVEKTTGHKLKVGLPPSYEYIRTTKKVPKGLLPRHDPEKRP
ncbi:MAG TPA: hypothetical protein VEL71_06370 [Candidatus Dormibacteraeota bacterium]|nr:hypothetical protein [Candidatus Dormibacteraeota bacterium]